MKLSVKERIHLLGILPMESDFSTLKIVRNLQSDLSFSEEEVKATNLVLKDNTYSWKDENDPQKDVQIGEKATDIIVAELKKLNIQKKLPMMMIDLYEKFIPEK